MNAAQVRIAGQNKTGHVGFCEYDDGTSIRVRFNSRGGRRGREKWSCDACGYQLTPTCAHVRAVELAAQARDLLTEMVL